MLVWLLNAGEDFCDFESGAVLNSRYRGSWIGDRVVVAGDHGVEQNLKEAIVSNGIYTDITVQVFKDLAVYSWWFFDHAKNEGFLDENGLYVAEATQREKLKKQRTENFAKPKRRTGFPSA